MKKNDLVLTLPQRLLLLFCFFLACYLLTLGCSFVLGKLLAGRVAAAVRIGAVVQDVLSFVIPAVATALLVTRRPAQLLCLRMTRQPLMFVLVVVMMFVSIPAQEAVIWWNYNISLPDAMKDFEQLMRQLEDMASSTMAVLMTDISMASLAVNILIVGVLAGLSEELLFRGCFQRLLTTAGVNHHLAVWSVAFCFSALHMQFFGFVPRMLLGAYFGYLLWWSRSLWLPVAAHILNNIVYVIVAWQSARTVGIAAVNEEPEPWPLWMTLASVAGIALILLCMWHLSCEKVPQSVHDC